ncbi:glutathione S-transferase [Exilibacterium tricleocarpae]|uniref:Glutathione S-transferase n=1 Tax=Exilibacterium tricleocarpae TaxID=2591008 RepID=A0A545UBG1_9GAMM|nr:glutathione S-transferase [Exilibacterium tricleocarpae]TQV86795.1 glutathione S-transferase [Exilibacterium tricleocarpae]
MLTLYSMSETSALAVHIALEWAEFSYQVKVLAGGDNNRLEYLQVSPLGKVPAAIFDDGKVLTETTALLTYVDAQRPEYFPLPARDNFGRAKLLETLSFYATELHGAFAPYFWPARFHPDQDEHAVLQAVGCERLLRLFDLTDDHFTGPYVFGPCRSVADPYLYVLTRWLSRTSLGLDNFPLLSAFKANMDMDEGVRRVLSAYKRQRPD